MRTVLFTITVVLAGLLGPATTALAQKTRPTPLRSTLEEETLVSRVVWPVFVSARRADDDATCLGLSPERVRITEDDFRVTVTRLDRERRPTLHALLIDTSESMSEKNALHLAREAAKRYVDRLQPHESIAVYTVDDIFLLRASMSEMKDAAAREEMKRAIDAIDASAGATHLRDALNQLILHVESYPARKVIIVLTDGVDTMSRLAPDRVLGTAMSTPRQDVTIYTVGIGLSVNSSGFVGQLAELTGGKYFGIREPDQIGATFEQVRARLASESYLSWIPRPFGQGSKDPGDAIYTFREIRIKSLDKRCKIDNPRGYRFSSQMPTKAPDFVSMDAATALPTIRPLPVGRHWQVAGPEPFELVADTESMYGTFNDVVREWGGLSDEGFRIRASEMSDEEIFAVRPFQVVVPALDTLLDGELSQPEDILLYWFRNEVRPSAADFGPESEMLVHGSTFLELREALAESFYSYYPPYRQWTRDRLAAPLERYLRYRFPDRDDSTIERLLLARLTQPSTHEIGSFLATWLGDLPARELASRLERRVINSLLSSSESDREANRELAELVDRRWEDIRRWFPEGEVVRILTPLVPLYDAGRREIGFYRVILPRADDAGNVASVAERPFGLRLVVGLLSDDETRTALRAERWRVLGVRHRTTLEPHLVHRTALDFQREDGGGSDRGTLILIRNDDTPNGPPLCVERLTAQPTVDSAVASLRLPACAVVDRSGAAAP
jgi:Ca-activated chloride channel family protein